MVHFVGCDVTRAASLDVLPSRQSRSVHAKSGVRALRSPDLSTIRWQNWGNERACVGDHSRAMLIRLGSEGVSIMVLSAVRVSTCPVVFLSRFTSTGHRAWRGFLAVLLALSVSPAWAETPTNVTRVEEDWELVVGEPSVDDTSPQIIGFISPTQRIDAECAVLELNHSTQPDYLDGGVQFQRWFGDFERIYRAPHTSNRLAIPGETITYTMTMRIESGLLKFGVRNGTSQTWGNFGGTIEQWNSSVVSPYANLDGYSPAISTKYSRVGYAANRVRKLSLKEVRYYRGDDLLQKDSGEKIVHETPVETGDE